MGLTPPIVKGNVLLNHPAFCRLFGVPFVLWSPETAVVGNIFLTKGLQYSSSTIGCRHWLTHVVLCITINGGARVLFFSSDFIQHSVYINEEERRVMLTVRKVLSQIIWYSIKQMVVYNIVYNKR